MHVKKKLEFFVSKQVLTIASSLTSSSCYSTLA